MTAHQRRRRGRGARPAPAGAGRLAGLREAFRSPRLVAGTSIVGFFVLLGDHRAVLRPATRTS